jgi:hypothetical protein
MFDVKGDWAAVAPGTVSLRAFVTPKMLERI